ncbi:MAG: thioesterase, partial [Firmicutes bacterium]|nr:thioesterase [Bacillota bacterium]
MKRDTLKKEYEITHATFCVAGYVPPSGLFNMFQEVATLHANELGFGWEAIDVLKRAFVITKQKVVIKNPLQKVGVVSCETWPVAGGGRIASREYIIRDKDGEVLVVSSSKWVLIDIEKRQIAKLDDVYQLPGIKFREDMAIEDAIFTKVLKNENFKLAETVVIKKSHIDV